MAPASKHQALVDLFQLRTSLVPEALRDWLHQELPDYQTLRTDSADLRDLAPAEVHADLVVLLEHERPVLAVVVEVQLRIDREKDFVWPLYIAGKARFSLPSPTRTIPAWVSTSATQASPQPPTSDRERCYIRSSSSAPSAP